jgi:periplasmic divalent cation tolerance protein
LTEIFVYVTAGNEAEALRIGRAVVEEQLAACANAIPGMRSLYWWEGRIQEAAETVLILKSTAALLDALAQRIQELHSYELPCVVALPIAGGNPAYLDWIRAECAPR